MQNHTASILVAAALAAGPPLCTGGCVAPPGEATTQQGVLTTSDMFGAMNVPDNGPATKTIALITYGGYPRFSNDLHDFRVNHAGLADVTSAVEKDQRGGTTFPGFDLAGATDAAVMADGIAITSPSAKLLVIHADTSGEADIAAAVDRARLIGCDTLVGVQQYGSVSTLGTALANARAAGIQVLWSIGTASNGTDGYLASATPQPAGVVDGSGNPVLLAIATTSLTSDMSARGFSETLIQESQTGNARAADASAPGNGPATVPTSSTAATFQNVSKSKALAAGLAAGSFVRHLAWVTPATLPGTGAAFFDLTAGKNFVSCSASICQAAAGSDGVSKWGTPNVAQF